MEHWKFGDGFAIRDGGRNGIQWFFGHEFSQPGSAPPVLPGHPAVLAIEAVKAVALILQWWEMRKQTQIAAAEFEERRLAWCTDMLALWGTEIARDHTMRSDSTHYLEREVGRLMAALLQTSKMDVSSTLLLQIERASVALVDLNSLVHSELLRRDATDLRLSKSDRVGVPHYQPFHKIRRLAGPDANFLDVVRRALPFLFPASLSDPLQEFLERKDRRSDLAPIENLALELRSAKGILQAADQLPIAVRQYTMDQLASGGEGDLVLASPVLPLPRQLLDG